MSEGTQRHGLPTSVTRTQLTEMVRILGIDPAEVVSIRMQSWAIEVEVYALNTRGTRYPASVGSVAIDKIHIPIVADDAPEGPQDPEGG